MGPKQWIWMLSRYEKCWHHKENSFRRRVDFKNEAAPSWSCTMESLAFLDRSTSKLGYAVAGGLWAAASLLSLPLANLSHFCICWGVIFSFTFLLRLHIQVRVDHAMSFGFLKNKFTCFGSHLFMRPQALSRHWVLPTLLKSVSQVTSTCYQCSINVVARTLLPPHPTPSYVYI